MYKLSLLGAAGVAALLFTVAPGIAADTNLNTNTATEGSVSAGGSSAGVKLDSGSSAGSAENGSSATAGSEAEMGASTSNSGGSDETGTATSGAGATADSKTMGEAADEAEAGSSATAGAEMGTSTKNSGGSAETGTATTVDSAVESTTESATGATTAATGSMTEPAATTQSELIARYDEIVGMNIVNADGDAVGEIEDIVIDPADGSAHAVVGVGGFLGLGEKEVTIPVKSLTFSDDEVRLNSMGTADELKARAEYAGDWESLKQ